jgi:hypothetical protein
MHSSLSTWWRKVLAPVCLGLLAFVVVQLLIARYAMWRADRSWTNMQPVRAVDGTGVALQIAVHDLVEALPRPFAVRVCRSLANRPVTIHAGPTDRLSAILGNLARQLDTDVTLGIEAPQDAALPSIVCPGGRAGDYVTIGTAVPRRRRPG